MLSLLLLLSQLVTAPSARAFIDTGSPQPSHSLLGGDGLLATPAKSTIENESSAGVVAVSGNSQADTYTLKQHNRYTFDPKNAMVLDANYLRATSLGVLSAFHWEWAVRYERSLTDKVSLIFGQGEVSDRFAGYLQRYNTDLGPRFILLREDKVWDWVGEVTGRYSHEHDIGDTYIDREQIRLFTEIKHQWTATASSGFYIEWVQSVHEMRDWQLHTEFSSSAAFTTVFSLKLAYALQYQNIPAISTAQKRDAQFTTNIVAKF